MLFYWRYGCSASNSELTKQADESTLFRTPVTYVPGLYNTRRRGGLAGGELIRREAIL
jgi:hypothetical protein